MCRWEKFIKKTKVLSTCNISNIKGQLISKCPFGVFKSSKKKPTKISALASRKSLNQKNYATNWRILF